MKKWYKSKTLWANLLSIAAILTQIYYRREIISPELQAALLGVINVILRVNTKDKIDWRGGGKNADY